MDKKKKVLYVSEYLEVKVNDVGIIWWDIDKQIESKIVQAKLEGRKEAFKECFDEALKLGWEGMNEFFKLKKELQKGD